jgi:hypothetical protein
VTNRVSGRMSLGKRRGDGANVHSTSAVERAIAAITRINATWTRHGLASHWWCDGLSANSGEGICCSDRHHGEEGHSATQGGEETGLSNRPPLGAAICATAAWAKITNRARGQPDQCVASGGRCVVRSGRRLLGSEPTRGALDGVQRASQR